MFEDTPEPEIAFHPINTKRLAGSLTFLCSDGQVNDSARDINWLWESAIGEYVDEIRSMGREDRYHPRANAFGGAHLLETDGPSNRSQKDLSRGELFLLTVDSFLFAERFSDEPVEINIQGKKTTALYKDLVKSEDDEKKRNVVKAKIKFAGEDRKFNGTTMIIDNGTIVVTEQHEGRDVPVIRIERYGSEDKTVVTVYKSTGEGEKKKISVPGRKIFWEIQNGLMWGDLYPHAQSVTAYMQRLDEPVISDVSEVEDEV